MTASQLTLNQFILDRGLRMSAYHASRNPNIDSPTMKHWRCVIRSAPSQGKSLSVFYSMGSAHEGRPPELAEVLDCLAADSCDLETTRNFGEWCEEFGESNDSRKAERTYKTIEQQAKRLKQFLGEADYKLLLWDVERL